MEVRQGETESWRPELYVRPNRPNCREETFSAVRSKIAALRQRFPGVGAEEGRDEILITIPVAMRVGHEAHFAQVARQFFAYLRGEESIPAWEKPNMLAKYYVTTQGVEIAARN